MEKMYKGKKYMHLCYIFICMFLLSACGSSSYDNDNESYTEFYTGPTASATYRNVEFEELVSDAPYILKTKCLSDKIEEGQEVSTFQVLENICGNIEQTVIESRVLDQGKFKPDTTYMLFAEKNTSAYSDDYYIVSCPITLDDQDKCISYFCIDHDFPEGTTYNQVCEENNSLRSKEISTFELKANAEFIKSDDISVIVEQSPFIATVSILETILEAPDRETFKCKIENLHKGDMPDECMIVFPKNTVEMGEDYLVLLITDSDDSLVYVLSSSDSLYAADSDTAEHIMELCSE